MNTLQQAEIIGLVGRHEGNCLSITLPTVVSGPDAQANPVRYRTLLHSAEEQLVARGDSPETIKHFLAAANKLLHDQAFWRHQGLGLAVYIGPQIFQTQRLPYPCDETLIIADRFQIAPLLPLLLGDNAFYVLALSQNEVRLLRGTQYTIEELPLPEGVPTSLADALRYDDLQPRTTIYAGTPGAAGRQNSMFYGRGDGREDKEQELLRYCQQIDRGLHSLLHDQQAPLILAGVDYLLPIYRQANSYAHLLAEGITGNPERKNMTPTTLRDQAWELVAPTFRQQQATALARYQQQAGTGLTADQLTDILPAAQAGRVAVLFLATDQHQWGTFDATTGVVTTNEMPQLGDEDLGNLAALETLRCGGSVYPLASADIPGTAPLAAIFRY